MTPQLLGALQASSGTALLAQASTLADLDPITAGARLRARGVPADLAAAALTQVELRRAALAKFGPDADRMFFTRTGLEQATRAAVARLRADRLTRAGCRRVADLGCGLGADTIALAQAGIAVDAVESDPLTAAIAEANAAALGLSGRVTVQCGQAETASLAAVDAVFCDPARRRGHRRVFDPAGFSPPWSFVVQLMQQIPATVLKLAPGIDHARLPAGAEAQWVSQAGALLETTLWCGPLAQVARRATVLPGGAADSDSAELTGTGRADAPVGAIRRYLVDPDAAVVRAHLVAELAVQLDATLADPSIAYLYTDVVPDTRFGRGYEIAASLPFSVKRLTSLLRDRGIGRLTIKKRGSAVDVVQLHHRLRPAGPAAATLILTRVAGKPHALITQALAGAGGAEQ